MNIMIKILYVMGGPMNYGGIELFLMNNIRLFDNSIFKIDLVIHGYEIGKFDDEIHNLGINIFKIPIRSMSPVKNYAELNKIVKNGKYDIVHSNLDAMGFIVMKIAKKNGVKIRVAHSHNTKHLTNNILKYFFNEIARFLIRFYANQFFACSKLAALWLFGKNITERKVIIIPNSIDYEKFLFNEATRVMLRKKFDLREKLVIGHIGRFDYQKNHEFLIEIIHKFSKMRKDVRLVLVGEGHLKHKIQNLVIKFGISDYVVFLSPCKEIYDYYNMFDVFCLPSHFEGLGMVLVEAQVNGLQCVASSKIPKDVNILKKVQFQNIKDSDSWINIINQTISKTREINISEFIKSGYSIKHQASKLQSLYINMVSELEI